MTSVIVLELLVVSFRKLYICIIFCFHFSFFKVPSSCFAFELDIEFICSVSQLLFFVCDAFYVFYAAHLNSLCLKMFYLNVAFV